MIRDYLAKNNHADFTDHITAETKRKKKYQILCKRL